ncbi:MULTISPECIES: acetyl-CoA decarbonylase/synthase complex subunit alpha/beta [Dehalobacter]|jgi:acetyl-CoA synthase|uniref:CO-methylating acetyl-CoA synthase n=2 Tax=Dehalobacter restrictus TaxID=55583 RepID=A0A857DFQ1_9FIRM|nr:MULTISPECIES: acetyl-CoA decarbonylase/synthase complex subunit alpha/beta [Dehalobacter]AHF08833.1 acetyl-CoA decarbonylase [Dehalobacter restrictus DSM 9455]MCG1024146.1 CO dehydrogenase/CO-methylating acetyl-CoA synthase complex subunit beta [Dehalobacter sp.]OCZ50009.1 CO dehydrogenase/CO-methylating acetyl-CoA synthase complex subunit beta [Dehalobacter sp. TeCB1]QGZ99331.1 CO dehydrogenase/CO-methylating acetyl-CoA synthase complex subunit beta [Dehalobacter restrictus]
MNLYSTIFAGAKQALDTAAGYVEKAISLKGREHKVAFPDTAYSLSLIYAITGKKIGTLGELEGALDLVRSLIVEKEQLREAENAGMAAAVSSEIIEALKYVVDEKPYEAPCMGFLTDAIIRGWGVGLVMDDIPGQAVIIGEFPDPESAAKVIKEYQAKGLLTFLVGKVIDQAIEGGVKVGLEFRVMPLGYNMTSVIHVVTVTIRAALIFGALTPGDWEEFKRYTYKRLKAFVNAVGPLSNYKVAAGAAAINLGFPVVTDQDVAEVPMKLITQKDYDKMAATSLEIRGIKIKITEIPIPVAFAAAFEGERIRKDAMFVEFGGSKTESWELVTQREASEIEDHKIVIIGDDIDTVQQVPGRMPLAVLVEVAGKSMHSDFEPVLERRIHYFMNYIEGIMHVGQRDATWIRISKDAYEKGFRLRHFGEVLYAKMLDEFGAVVDKCQVTIITDPDKVKEVKTQQVVPKYAARDERIASLTDESVDTFYTCILCQSFAPSHVCIVTPERLGLCGAVSWLDSKATFELDPTGPCQPINKGPVDDPVKGIWQEVNKTVERHSQGALSQITLYSLLEDPMTSCGCFECIAGIMPEANGIVIVNREFSGVSPVGMTFGELASMTGGGVQTPGFMGHGRQFISSKKFISAEGGPGRIVWMPKELKEFVADKLNATAKEMYGIDNFVDMICDETIASESEAVLEYLSEKGHPALTMDPLM